MSYRSATAPETDKSLGRVRGRAAVVDGEAVVAVQPADVAARVVGLDEAGLELRVEHDHAVAVAQALPVADLPEIVEDLLRLLGLEQLPAAVEGDPPPQLRDLVEEPVAVAARGEHACVRIVVRHLP